jgi:hypothetical protein
VQLESFADASFNIIRFTFGIFTSYWVDYSLARNVSDTDSKQWQLPVGLQILFATLLGLGTLTLKESVRWLAAKGRDNEAWQSLVWIRANDDNDVRSEMDEIREGVDLESSERQGFKLKGECSLLNT